MYTAKVIPKKLWIGQVVHALTVAVSRINGRATNKNLYFLYEMHPLVGAAPNGDNPIGLPAKRLAPTTNNIFQKSKKQGANMSKTNFKKAVAIVVTTASLIFGTPMAGAQNTPFIKGFASCGKWVDEKRPDFKHGQVMWLLGYLSGVSTGIGKGLIKDIDNESITLWVDNYCRANPLKDTGDAGTALVVELIKKK